MADHLDPEKIDNRTDAEAYVQRIKRPCRGPLKEGVQEQINALLTEGTEEARHAAAALGRKFRGIPRKDPQGIVYDPCGYDFNLTIVSQALDGKGDHTYVCPKCGVTGSYTAPWFPALPEEDMGASDTPVSEDAIPPPPADERR